MVIVYVYHVKSTSFTFSFPSLPLYLILNQAMKYLHTQRKKKNFNYFFLKIKNCHIQMGAVQIASSIFLSSPSIYFMASIITLTSTFYKFYISIFFNLLKSCLFLTFKFKPITQSCSDNSLRF